MPALDYSRLASFYDAMVTDRGDLPFFLRAARAADGPVAELMAGTGRLAVPLVESGIDMTCVDSSPEMLGILSDKLAAKGLRARVVCDDVTLMNIEDRFRLVFIAFHSFEELLEDADERACLDTARRHLGENGRFICTLHDIATRLAAVGPGKGGRWQFPDLRSQRQIALSLETEYDSHAGVVHGVESFTYLGDKDPFLEVPLRFRLVRPDTFLRMVQDAGFVVESVGADFTSEEYREGQATTAVWTLRPRATG